MYKQLGNLGQAGAYLLYVQKKGFMMGNFISQNGGPTYLVNDALRFSSIDAAKNYLGANFDLANLMVARVQAADTYDVVWEWSGDIGTFDFINTGDPASAIAFGSGSPTTLQQWYNKLTAAEKTMLGVETSLIEGAGKWAKIIKGAAFAFLKSADYASIDDAATQFKNTVFMAMEPDTYNVMETVIADYSDQWRALFDESVRIYKNINAPLPAPLFGQHPPEWNPQGASNITITNDSGITDTVIGAPKWGQRIDSLLSFAKPSHAFPGSYAPSAELREAYGNFTDESVYGTELKTLADYRAFKGNAVGWKTADEYTWWIFTLLGMKAFNVNGQLVVRQWQNKSALSAGYLADAWRFKHWRQKGETAVKRERPVFITGNYAGWRDMYLNSKWFKLAVDTVTTWVFVDRNKLDIIAPASYQYSAPAFSGYGGYDAGDPAQSSVNVPFGANANLFPNSALTKYRANINYPWRVQYAAWPRAGSKHIDNLTGDSGRLVLLAVHYLIKYPPLEKLPSPPFHTTPESANYQFLVNALNINRYVNTIIRSGLAMDSGRSGPVPVSYLPALEPPERGTLLERIGDALERAAADVVEFHLDAFKMLTFGTTDTAEWITRATMAASVAAMVSGLPLSTEGAKSWLQAKAMDLVGAKLLEKAQVEIAEEIHGDDMDAIQDEQAAIIQAAEKQAAEEQAAIQAAEDRAAQAEAGVTASKQELTTFGKRAILPLTAAVLLAIFGG